MSVEQTRIQLHKYSPQLEALKLIPEAMARKYMVLPLVVEGNTLRVVMRDATDIYTFEALEAHTKKRIEIEVASAEEIREGIDSNYQSYEEIEKYISDIPMSIDTSESGIELDTVTNAPVAKAITLIIQEAVKARASDIHLQPFLMPFYARYWCRLLMAEVG